MDDVVAMHGADEEKLLRAQYALLKGLTSEHVQKVRASLRLALRAKAFVRRPTIGAGAAGRR